jgi:hypothetical protein
VSATQIVVRESIETAAAWLPRFFENSLVIRVNARQGIRGPIDPFGVPDTLTYALADIEHWGAVCC